MATRVRARWWTGILTSLLVSTAALGAPLPSDTGARHTEPTEDIEVPTEAGRDEPATVSDIKPTDGQRRRSEQESRRQRAGDKPADDMRPTKPDNAVPARAATGSMARAAQGQDGSDGTINERLFESVRAPLSTLAGGGTTGNADDVAARAALTAQRRTEMAAATISAESRGGSNSGRDDAVLSAIRMAREALREPLVWLLIVVVAGIVLTISYVSRRQS